MKPLGVAVVGVGTWGANLARNLSGSSDYALRWVCDLHGERARASAHSRGVRATTALDQVLEDSGVEAVAIATPAASHAEVAMACLDTGRHVLVEKPMALSVAEAQKLSGAAAQRGLTLMCDHTYNYAPAVRTIRAVIRSGELGHLHYVNSVRVNRGRVQPDVDVFWDLAHHDLSILDFILPEGCRPTTVTAQGADPLGTGRACLGYLTLRLAGSVIAHTHISWLNPTKVRTVVVGGSRGTLVWDDLHPTHRLLMHPRGAELAESDEAGATGSHRERSPVALPLPETEPLSGVVTEFAAAIREGRAPLSDAAAELRVLAVLEAVVGSLAGGGVPLSVESRRYPDPP
jgi:predicted dehydrogenase